MYMKQIKNKKKFHNLLQNKMYYKLYIKLNIYEQSHSEYRYKYIPNLWDLRGWARLTINLEKQNKKTSLHILKSAKLPINLNNNNNNNNSENTVN